VKLGVGQYSMNAEPGAYGLTGPTADLVFATAGVFSLQAEPAAYVLSVNDALLIQGGQEPNLDPILTGWIAAPNAGGRIRKEGVTA
jgi:hypothetical protein